MKRDFFLFPWRADPFLWGIAFFIVNPGMVLLLRIFAEDGLYWTRWKSFQFGDIIFLPLFAVCASLVIAWETSEKVHPRASSILWQSVFFVGGALVFAGTQILHVLTEDGYSEVFFLPSELWHTAISFVLPYEMLWGFFAAIGARKTAPTLVFVLAMVFAGGYVAAIAYDNFLPW